MASERSSRTKKGGALCLCLYLLWGCCVFPYRTPGDIERWQDTAPPVLTLAQKAAKYQSGIQERHQLADGVIRYKTRLGTDGPQAGYGNLADGSFFQGIYLAGQALRLAATGDPAAREQVLSALRGMGALRGGVGEARTPGPVRGGSRSLTTLDGSSRRRARGISGGRTSARISTRAMCTVSE